MEDYSCFKHSLSESETIENILYSSNETPYYFENKEGVKVLGYFPKIEAEANSPYAFYYQEFESKKPILINCSVILVQKDKELWVYEKDGFSQSFQKNFAPLLDKTFNEEQFQNVSIDYNPQKEEWFERVNKVLELTHSFESDLSKVVLSRSLALSFQNSINLMSVFKKLKSLQKNTFKILFPLNEKEKFISFTPERILMSNGKDTHFEAIAGTRPRGKTEQEDLLLEKQLEESIKEEKEHQKVVEQITDALATFSTLSIGKRRVLKLRGIQHLLTPIKAKLNDGDKLSQLMGLATALHPTPAVGGTPQKEAKDIILEIEGKRGPYAGLFGIISSEHTELAVLIRSAKISDKTLTAYAGAGIVQGSEPDSEWKETHEKFKSFLGDLL